MWNKISSEEKCEESVRRGGPSSGGGYDAMNFTRYESCGKPAVKTRGGVPRCQRHSDRYDEDIEKRRRLHEQRQEQLSQQQQIQQQQQQKRKSSPCNKDEQGFHVDENGRRTMERDGRDAYARRCTQCGIIGYPSRDWSRFIEGEDGWMHR